MGKKIIFTISFILFFVLITRVYAQVPPTDTSSSYILTDPVFGESGPYTQSSPSFQEKSTLGQLVTGVSQSTNFILKSGFEYYSGQSVPSITMSINTNSINFGNLLPGTIYKSPTNTIITISSNSEMGYNLYASENNNLVNNQGFQIPPVNNGATSTTAAAYTSTAYTGLGYNCSTSNSFEQAVLADNPIAFWALSETTGTTAYDLSGNGNNGTYTGGYTQGEQGPISNSNLDKSTYFNGSTSYINLPQNLTNNANFSTLTFSLWFKTTSDGTLLGNQNSTVGITPGFDNSLLYIGTNGYLCGGIDIPPGFCNSTNINDGKWHNAVLTVNNSSGQSLYLDGQLVNTAGVPNTFSTNYTQIGVGYDQGWTYASAGWFYFKGEISNVAVYHTALTQSQIQTIFNAGIDNQSPFCNNDFINTNYYRQLSSTPTQFASFSSIANNQSIAVGYAVNIPATQASGNYTNTITYTLAGNY